MDDIFPSRKQIIENLKNKEMLSGYQESIINQIKEVDVEKVDFSKGDFKPRTKIAEKQKVYIWIRLYLKEEDTKTKPNDPVKITYTNGEELDTTFICYSKKGIQHDSNEIVNYDTEDDRKVLCLMVDLDRINTNSDDIPFIRTMFKTGRYYEYQLIRRDEFKFLNTKTNEIYEYYDVEF